MGYLQTRSTFEPLGYHAYLTKYQLNPHKRFGLLHHVVHHYNVQPIFDTNSCQMDLVNNHNQSLIRQNVGIFL